MAMTNGMNYNTPGFNPYTQNFYPTYPQIQPMQTYGTPSNPPANRNVFGRVVNSETDITPNEVPMDGSVSLFPMADYSKIFAKQWNPDGTIKTTVFVIDAKPANQNNYLIGQLRPSPVPAYTVANPYAGFGYGCCGTAQSCCC